MRIGLDAKRAFLNNTGLGNYSRAVIRALLEHYPGNHYFLFTPKIREDAFLEEMNAHENVTIVQPRSKFLHAYWRSFSIKRDILDHKLDVYHGLSNELPFTITSSKVRAVVTMHDLIPFKDESFQKIFDIITTKRKMWKACKNADSIVAISEQTKRDILHFFNTKENKIHVVYQPVGLHSTKANLDVVKKFSLPPHYILQVGTVEYRKNIQVILQAMIKINDPGLHYVVVGRKKSFQKSLASYGGNHGLGGHVHYMDAVSDEDLAGMYECAAAVMYPSMYEGFGLPIIEAIRFGKPVLTTKGGCFEEAGGPGAYYCDTESIDEVADTIQKILNTDSSAMIEAGQKYILRFNSKSAADGLMAVYKGVDSFS